MSLPPAYSDWSPIMYNASRPVLDQRNFDGAEGFLSREILDLNANSRNANYEEIHGVHCMAPEETPKLIVESLEAFWAAVRAIPESSKVAYSQCRRIATLGKINSNATHYAIDDPSFHLRFLRSELFDAQKAATRYINYLNFAHTHWGDIALQREIGFSDLSKQEAKLIRKGYYQILPVRDKSGRRVIAGLRKLSFVEGFDDITKIKTLFYLWNSVTFRDAESQRKGVVGITFDNSLSWRNADFKKIFTRDRKNLVTSFFASIATRVVAIHHCLPDNAITAIMKVALAMKITGKDQRVRFLFHMHEDHESTDNAALYTQYKLKGYGIPIELLPMTESGVITTKNHTIWTKTRKLFEEGQFEEASDGVGKGVFRVQFPNRPSSTLIVDCPCSDDVLFRQGKTMMEHPGNVMFRDVILDYLDREDAWKANGSLGVETSTEQVAYGKQQFLNSWIWKEILDRRKGRFLEWDREQSVWTLMTDLVTIKSKISVVYMKYRKLKSEPAHASATTETTSEEAQPVVTGSSAIWNPIGSCDSSSDATVGSVAAAYQFLGNTPRAMPEFCQGGLFCNQNRNQVGNQNFTPSASATLEAAYNAMAVREASRKRSRKY